jgi:hypothetical protein
MTRTSTLLVMPGVCFLALAAHAQSRTAPPQITFPSAEVHRLESKHVGAPFAVRVLMPPTLEFSRTKRT